VMGMHLEWCSQGMGNLSGQHGTVFTIANPVKQNEKFVASQPSHGVGTANLLPDEYCHLLQ
jgi:hypothetical protein